MRVLHVVKKFPPLIGGDATAVAALSRAQRRAGDEVDVLTYEPPAACASASRSEEPAVHRVGPRQSSEELDRITLRRVRGMGAMRRWARANLPAMRPDVVHAHAADVGYAVSRIARDHRLSSVLTCHGVWFPTRGPLSPWGRLERYLIRRGGYDAITSVDGGSVAALRAAGFPSAEYVPNGVDLAEFEVPRPPDGPFRFLFAGRHEAQKGLDVLLDAATHVRAQVGDGFAVRIVGHGSLSRTLAERARSAGLDGVVHFAGIVSREELRHEFRSADAFVLPSRHEGFPVAILEAWAAHLPVIATAVGGVPSVCTPQTAVLVPPNDPAALATAMVDVLRHPDRREALATGGYRLARDRFTWDAVAERYRAVYQGVRPG